MVYLRRRMSVARGKPLNQCWTLLLPTEFDHFLLFLSFGHWLPRCGLKKASVKKKLCRRPREFVQAAFLDASESLLHVVHLSVDHVINLPPVNPPTAERRPTA